MAFVLFRINDWRIRKAKEYLQEAKSNTNTSESLTLYEQAAFLDPSEETYLQVGITALSLGHSDLAGKYLTRVKTAEGYYQLATAYYNLSKYDLSATYFQKSLDKKVTSAAYLGLGKSLLKVGEVERSREALTKSDDPDKLVALLDQQPGETGERAVAAYNALNTLGYPQSAKYILQKATDNNDVTRDGLITLANSHIDAGEYQSAYDLLVRSKAIDPYYPQIYNHLILVSEKLGKTEEASNYREFYKKISF